MFQIKGSVHLDGNSWIEYSDEKIADGALAKLYGWRSPVLNGIRNNFYTTIDVNIVDIDICKKNLRFKYIYPKQQMCGKFLGDFSEFVSVGSLYNYYYI